jgi:hypothetical protein
LQQDERDVEIIVLIFALLQVLDLSLHTPDYSDVYDEVKHVDQLEDQVLLIVIEIIVALYLLTPHYELIQFVVYTDHVYDGVVCLLLISPGTKVLEICKVLAVDAVTVLSQELQESSLSGHHLIYARNLLRPPPRQLPGDIFHVGLFHNIHKSIRPFICCPILLPSRVTVSIFS